MRGLARVVHASAPSMMHWRIAAPELAGWGEQLGGGVERRTVVNPFPRAVGGMATVIDISHGQHLHVRSRRVVHLSMFLAGRSPSCIAALCDYADAV